MVYASSFMVLLNDLAGFVVYGLRFMVLLCECFDKIFFHFVSHRILLVRIIMIKITTLFSLVLGSSFGGFVTALRKKASINEALPVFIDENYLFAFEFGTILPFVKISFLFFPFCILKEIIRVNIW